jgi:arylsulfatase A-like enzyme
MKHLPILFVQLLVLCSSMLAASKPNVIVIFCDDLGWSDLGVQGIRKDIRTPNLDALARGGLLATNGYVTAPQCVPSRAGLLSGRYQPRFGVESNGAELSGFDAQATIAERLKNAGYATGMTGKWHLGPNDKITTHGFDDVYCNQGARGKAWANFDLNGAPIPGGDITSPEYHLDANSSAACAFIKRHKTEPFFFYLAYRAPHVPLDPTQQYLDRFPGEMPECRRRCLAMMSAVDDGVGRVMDTLRQNGLEENTLIFFMGDNGAPLKITMPDRPDGPGWDGSLNLPMNGEKGMLSEGGIREPWIAYWKGRIPAGQVYQQPVISLDVAATAVAVAGLPRDPQLDGVNVMPYFTGEKEGAPHEVLFWRWEAQSAIREGKWKLLVGGKRSYLYDLEVDPGEKHNQLAQRPDLAKSLRAKLERWASELQPPGINLRPMAATWDQYFDFYLEGKPAPAPEDEKENGKRKARAKMKKSADAKGASKSAAPAPADLFELRDVNKDGKVTWEEFLNKRTGPTVPALEKRFENFDRDGDGVWTRSEPPSAAKPKD